MPTIRDVVRALGGRDGVDAVIVLGRDGLPIDSHATDGIDTESVAALVPTVVGACNRLGSASERGEFGTSVVEYDAGMIMVTGLTAETLLAILVAPATNIGALLYEIHRHRSAIADLL